MSVLWAESPLDSGEVVRRVAPVEDWSPKTVRTLLDRLVGKGALKRRKSGQRYQYEPLIEREHWLRDQTENLLDHHCDGRLAPLVAAFARSERLTADDRREILELLEKLK